MTNEQYEGLITALKAIKRDLPAEVDMGETEKQLDRVCTLLERNNELLEALDNRLENIEDRIPLYSQSVDTSKMERQLEEIGGSLSDIASYTSNISG